MFYFFFNSPLSLPKIFRHLLHQRPTVEAVYDVVVDGIIDAGLELRIFVGDGKERKIAKFFVQTRAYFACDFGLAKGNAIPDPSDPSDDRAKVRGIFYGTKHQVCEERTRAGTLEHAEKARGEKTGSFMGVKGVSPFFRLHYFDVIWGMPFDAMHQLDYGLIKMMVKLMFFGGRSVEMLAGQSKFQRAVCSVKIPTEFERRTKSLELDMTKTKEFKLIGLFTFLAVARAHFPVTEGGEAVQKILLKMCFLYRALMMPQTAQYQRIKESIDLQVSAPLAIYQI